jgi:aryl-alcohol dehydrogenase-like predicted oxidoreductase
MSIAWLLTHAYVPTVIAGADQVSHIEDNVRALEVELSAADLAELDRLTLVDEDRTVAPVIRRLR